jgi:hypothetical protein
MFKTLRNVALPIIFGILMCGVLFAQQPQASEVQRYRQEIQACSQVVDSWQWQADVQILFVVSVICFGALITIFQGINKGWCKPATLVLGAATTILTGINARVFQADYRVLQQSVIDGSSLISDLNGIVDGFGQPQADVNGLKARWVATKTQFNGLRKAVLQGKSSAALHIWKTVYAQSSVPTWMTSPPTDKSNLYFSGMAEDRSIEVARQRSVDNAAAAGVAQLSTDGTDRELLGKVIASSSAVEKSYFEFDKNIRSLPVLHATAD